MPEQSRKAKEDAWVNSAIGRIMAQPRGQPGGSFTDMDHLADPNNPIGAVLNDPKYDELHAYGQSLAASGPTYPMDRSVGHQILKAAEGISDQHREELAKFLMSRGY